MIFSVVIPVYNVKDYLPKCIDSVLAQDFTDYEVILIDDGSTDGESGAICDRYAAAHPERIRAIHKPNGGVGEARNVGIEAAQGEYLIFIDSDDYIAPGMFRVLSDAVARFGSDIIGFGAALEANGVVVKELVDRLPTDRTFTLADTPELMQTMPSPWSRIWRRSLFLDSGVRYPARIWYEDLCTSVKLLALARSAAFVPDILYYYVDRTNSITRNTNTARNAELFTAFDNLLDWYRENGLFERYYNELSRLAVDHVLLAASVRVLRVDPQSELLDRFQDYVQAQFPDYMENPYLQTLSRSHKLILRLLRQRKYRTVRMLFAVKDKLGCAPGLEEAMKFSVIIPVYNGWEYLRACVDSVLEQTGADFEILLVDDGSTDGESGALCDTLAREHPDCIRVLHKPNGGAGDARNAALPLAQGDYVLFLDSDDSYTPEAFAVLSAALEALASDVCYFGLRMTGDNDGAVFTDDLPLRTPLTLPETPALLLNRPSACIAAWRRTLFTGTDIRFRARGWGEDLCMTRKMLTAARSVVILPDVLYLYRQHAGSVTKRALDANAEIMDAIDDVLTWYQARGLFEQYENELGKLCVDNVLYDASVRILKAQSTHPLLPQLLDFTAARFPDYRHNPYLKGYPARKKLVLSLLGKKQYRAVHMLFAAAGH